MAVLLIRAAMNDHVVVGDLLASGGGPRLVSRRPPISQLVADGHVAAARPVLADHARSGNPVRRRPRHVAAAVIDRSGGPLGPPVFAEAEAMAPRYVRLDELIESVIEFEVEQGVNVVVPPYFYASSPADPWFHLTVRSIQRTAAYLEESGYDCP